MDKCTNPTSASLYTQVMGTKTVLKKRRKKKGTCYAEGRSEKGGGVIEQWERRQIISTK